MVVERLAKHSISFRYAFKGLYYALKTQPNFSAHLFFAAVAVGLGLFFRISRIEWLVLVLTISAVFVVEMINTAIEVVTDALKEHKRNERDDYYIMVAKDIGAGAVLISALASVVVGLIVFGPKILSFITPSI